MPKKSIKQKVIISVTNDLVADYRVHKVATSLIKFGFEVLLIGRKLKSSLPIDRTYKTKRFNLIFSKGLFFYAEYNFRLFIFFLFCRVNIYLSNDLDTLLPNLLAAKIRRKKLVYDSHEYFTEVPELLNRKRIKRIWEKIEKFSLPKVKYSYTVCESIADIYNNKYNLDMKVVRNIPEFKAEIKHAKNDLISAYNDKHIILYQGSVNMGRGLKYVIEAMKFIDDSVFFIIGFGDLFNELRQKVVELNLEDKVIFTGKIPFADVISFTKNADIGISLEENIGLNYYYALPNKLFDYIHAKVPVLVSRLPEIEKIVNKYDIGCFIEKHDPEHIAEKIRYMLTTTRKIEFWKENLNKASEALTWEKEEIVLKSVFNSISLSDGN